MPRTPSSSYRKQAGFSMVELMVAMVLGLFVTTAVLQIFVGAKQAYEFQEEFSRIQENGRFAIDFLTKDIRAADFWGCLSNSSNITSNASGSVGTALEGYDAIPLATSQYSPALGPLADGILLRTTFGMDMLATPPGSGASASNSTRIQLSKGNPFVPGDQVVISDCNVGVVLTVVNPSNLGDDHFKHGVSGGLNLPGNTNYQVFGFESIRYWLRNNVRGEPVLVRGQDGDPWDTGGDELVEGVENFQILYGVDSSGNKTPNYFVPADQVSDAAASISMENVVSVQIHLLIRSLRDNMLDEPQAIDYYGQSRINVDRHLRKAFTTTVAIRNRLD